jgi:hypothetical protein
MHTYTSAPVGGHTDFEYTLTHNHTITEREKDTCRHTHTPTHLCVSGHTDFESLKSQVEIADADGEHPDVVPHVSPVLVWYARVRACVCVCVCVYVRVREKDKSNV